MKDKDLTVILSVLIGIPAIIAFLLFLVLFPTFVNRENMDKRDERKAFAASGAIAMLTAVSGSPNRARSR